MNVSVLAAVFLKNLIILPEIVAFKKFLVKYSAGTESNTLGVYELFYKLICFETFIIFLKPTIKLITGIFDLQK